LGRWESQSGKEKLGGIGGCIAVVLQTVFKGFVSFFKLGIIRSVLVWGVAGTPIINILGMLLTLNSQEKVSKDIFTYRIRMCISIC
jgi:hypothetical protein